MLHTHAHMSLWYTTHLIGLREGKSIVLCKSFEFINDGTEKKFSVAWNPG